MRPGRTARARDGRSDGARPMETGAWRPLRTCRLLSPTALCPSGLFRYCADGLTYRQRGDADTPQERGEAGIRTDGVEERLSDDVEKEGVTAAVGLFEPRERLVCRARRRKP